MTKLRQRIIEAVPVILELLAHDRLPSSLGGDVDPRPVIVSKIKAIAELETTPKFEARRALDRVLQDVKRLELSIAKLPPSARRLVELNVEGLDDALSSVENETGRTAASRKLVAATAALDLLADWGSNSATLYPDGPYVEIASILFYAAVGRRGSLRRSCAQHFDALAKEDGVDFRSKRRGPRERIDDAPDHIRAALSRQRSKPNWPPLEDVVDAALKS